MTRTARQIRYVLSAVVAVVVVVSCAQGGQQDSITVAVAIDNSEQTASIGRAVLFGAMYEAAEKLAPRVEVILFDDTNDAEVARRQALELVASDVVAVVGHASSGITIEAESVYGRFQLPLVMPVATHPGITSIAADRGWMNAFRLVPTHDLQASTIVEFALERLLCTQPLVLNDSTDYGVDLGQKLEQVFRSAGVNFSIRASVPSVSDAGVDYSSIVENVERFESTCIVFAGYYEEASALIRQVRAAGAPTPIVLTDGSFQTDLFFGSGADMSSVYVAFVAPDWSTVEAAGPLIQAFEAQYPEADPSFAPFGADAVSAIWQAAVSAGRRTREGVLDGLRSSSFVLGGIGGTYRFNSIGDAETGANYIYRVVEEGDQRRFECVTCR